MENRHESEHDDDSSKPSPMIAPSVESAYNQFALFYVLLQFQRRLRQ